jgi:hypothetical protein
VQRRDIVLQQRFALVSRPSPSEEIKFKTSLGELKGKAEIYELFYNQLAAGPKTTAELMQVETAKPLTLGDMLQALAFMLNAGHITFYLPLANPQPALELNRQIALAVAAGAPYRFVIATQIGHVLTVSDVDLIFLAAVLKQGDIAAPELGTQLTDCLLALGKGINRDGKALITRDDLLPHAQEIAKTFLETTLPEWKRLGVCV